MPNALEKPLDFRTLKDKQRELRSGFPEALGLRVHRAISWLFRAECEEDDDDVRFILLWIGFNSAYAGEILHDGLNERGVFKNYFEILVYLDHHQRIYNCVWGRFPEEIDILLRNKYVFAPFWNHANGKPGSEGWAESLSASQRAVGFAFSDRDTTRILSIVFDRLYVLRNQLLHGGATWDSTINRNQVRDGAAILGWLLPIFIDIMMDNPQRDWGKPFYPVVS